MLISPAIAEIQTIIIKYNISDIEKIESLEETFQLKRIYYSRRLSVGHYSSVRDIDDLLNEINKLDEVDKASRDVNVPPNSYIYDSYHINNANGPDINWNNAKNYIQKKTPQNDPIIIAIIDDGLSWQDSYFSNENLAFNINDPINGVDDDNNGYIDDYLGWDFANNNNDVIPESPLLGHGDRVTSMILSSIESNDLCANQNIKILPLKRSKIDSSTGEPLHLTSTIFEALDYAIDMGADIINMSLGRFSSVEYFDYWYRPLFEALLENDILVVCSAGNDGINTDASVYEPAYASQIFDNVISVGAIDDSGDLFSYQDSGGETVGSNFGKLAVDVAAPGHLLYTYNPQQAETETVWYNIDINNGDFFSSWSTGSLLGNSSSLSWQWQYDNDENVGYLHDGAGSESYNFTERYEPNTDTYVVSEWISLTNISNPILETRLFYDLDEQNADKLLIEATANEIDFDILETYTGNYDQTLDHTKIISLNQYTDQAIKIRIRLKTNNTTQESGIRIRSFNIKGGSKFVRTSGTSLAAPIVSAVAGLVKSLNPELSAVEIKNIILSTAKPLESLEDKIVSGGYIDAFDSLYAVNNKQKIHYSFNLNNWLLLEDFFSNELIPDELNDYEDFKINYKFDINDQNLSGKRIILLLTGKNKLTNLRSNIVSRPVSILSSPKFFIKSEDYIR